MTDLDLHDLRRIAVSLSQRNDRLVQLADEYLPSSDFDAHQNAQRAEMRASYRAEAANVSRLWKRVSEALYAAENGGATLFGEEG